MDIIKSEISFSFSMIIILVEASSNSVSELSNNEANIRYFSDNVYNLKKPTIEMNNNVTIPFNPATIFVLTASHSRKGEINVIAAAITRAGHTLKDKVFVE